MLDKWLNVIAQRLNTTAAAVIAKRIAIEKERASDTARDHAGREFVNSEGYTTPLPKAAQNAQNEYARARRDFEKVDLMGALSVAVTMMIARERRDETAAALKAYLEAENLRQSEGVHPEVKPFFADLFAMGIEPRRLPYVREEVLAIICDMIMWDGHDRDMQDADSPMPAIFDLYGSRLILKPGQMYARSRSVPGVPVKPIKYIDPKHYMFNELVKPHQGLPFPEGAQSNVDSVAIEDVALAPGADPEVEQQPQNVQPLDAQSVSVTMERVVQIDDIQPAPMGAQIPEIDEYALPPHISPSDAATLLIGGERWVDLDTDWPFELKFAIGYVAKTDADIIAAVGSATQPSGVTPFQYFLEAAKRDGVEAGHAAYREATSRRFAFEFATRDEWKDVRANLGLSW